MELPELKIKHGIKDMPKSFGISKARRREADKKMGEIFRKGLTQRGYNESHAIQEMYEFCNDMQEVACFLWVLSKRIIATMAMMDKEK